LRWPDCGLQPADVQTNIVIFANSEPDKLLDHLARDGVLAGTIAPRTVRLVTHHDVDDAGVGRAVDSLRSAAD
jgi:threonine aldolase